MNRQQIKDMIDMALHIEMANHRCLYHNPDLGVERFDCPECKHETLSINSSIVRNLSAYNTQIVSTRKCIVCGKTFQKVTTQSYEEIK